MRSRKPPTHTQTLTHRPAQALERLIGEAVARGEKLAAEEEALEARLADLKRRIVRRGTPPPPHTHTHTHRHHHTKKTIPSRPKTIPSYHHHHHTHTHTHTRARRSPAEVSPRCIPPPPPGLVPGARPRDFLREEGGGGGRGERDVSEGAEREGETERKQESEERTGRDETRQIPSRRGFRCETPPPAAGRRRHSTPRPLPRPHPYMPARPRASASAIDRYFYAADA